MLSLAGLAIIGASAALFIPSYTNWFRENDSAKTQQPISTPATYTERSGYWKSAKTGIQKLCF